MDFNNIIVTTDAGLGKIIVNRPKKLNALNNETIAELHEAFKALEAADDVRVIIITGSGEKAFVAGADIAEFAAYEVAEGKALAARGHKILFDFVENLKKPVIAAINGYALGGGLELAMACHIRVASDMAHMGLPEVSLGVIPGYGGTQRLPNLIGKGRAFEMIMTGGMIGTEQALMWGLINHLVAQEELLPFCEKIADKIIKNSPVAITTAIEVVNSGFVDGVNGFEKEIEGFGYCFGTADFKEGTTAFMEKRKAIFPGK